MIWVSPHVFFLLVELLVMTQSFVEWIYHNFVYLWEELHKTGKKRTSLSKVDFGKLAASVRVALQVILKVFDAMSMQML